MKNFVIYGSNWCRSGICIFLCYCIDGYIWLCLEKIGPIKSLIVYFLIIFLAALAAGEWATPVGPEFWGYYWLPGLVIAIIFALLIAAASPASRSINETSERVSTKKAKREKKDEVQSEITAASYYSTKATPKGEDMNEAEEEKDAQVINSFIWILMAILLVLAIAGIMN